MGRSGPTVREQFDRLEREWRPFRRTLRRRHRPAFDRLFAHARGHADAAGQQNPRDPWRAFVVAVLLAQEAELRALREACAANESTAAADTVNEGRAAPPDDGESHRAGTDADDVERGGRR